MKNILFFIHDLGNGGAEKVLVNLANNLDKSKFSVTIMALFAGGENEKLLNSEVNYLTVFSKPFPANSKILSLFSPVFLHKRFIKNKYDIEISYLEGPSARIISGCKDKDTKLVNWIHCKIDNKRIATIGFRNFSEAKRCYEKFDFTACVSKKVKEYFVKTFDYQDKIGVVYNTIDTDYIQKKALEPIDDVCFSRESYNICSVGKIVKIKNFIRLAKVHKRLLDSGIKNKVYIIGEGPDKSSIDKYLDENKLKDSFIFLGYKSNPYKYVKACDLYVCSSNSEGFSTSVTEALIVGTPVVTTLCSGMQEILGENNEYGIITENNEDALFYGIKRILTIDGLIDYYAGKAMKRGEFFSAEKAVKSVEDLLLSL